MFSNHVKLSLIVILVCVGLLFHIVFIQDIKNLHSSQKAWIEKNSFNKILEDIPQNYVKENKTIYEKRRQVLQNACMSSPYRRKTKFRKTKQKYLLYNKKNNLLFCFVQKIGCTFWKRIFLSLENKEVKNLTDQSLVHKISLPTLGQYSDEDVVKLAKSAISVLFVRDPYSRLLSGYIDKFLYPNPHYWTVYGTHIINKYRENPTELSRRCGHDVTFPEFVEYVVDTYENKPHDLEDHFSPIYQHCRPCEISYKIIGKMETFENDVNYVFNKLSHFNQSRYSVVRNIDQELVKTKIDIDHYQRLNNSCLSDEETAYRVLKSLHHRGIVNFKDAYKHNLMNIIKTLDVSNTSKYTKMFPNKISRRERRQNLVRHYKSLNKTLLEKVSNFLKPDCQLFGYNHRPDDIF